MAVKIPVVIGQKGNMPSPEVLAYAKQIGVTIAGRVNSSGELRLNPTNAELNAFETNLRDRCISSEFEVLYMDENAAMTAAFAGDPAGIISLSKYMRVIGLVARSVPKPIKNILVYGIPRIAEQLPQPIARLMAAHPRFVYMPDNYLIVRDQLPAQLAGMAEANKQAVALSGPPTTSDSILCAAAVCDQVDPGNKVETIGALTDAEMLAVVRNAVQSGAKMIFWWKSNKTLPVDQMRLFKLTTVECGYPDPTVPPAQSPGDSDPDAGTPPTPPTTDAPPTNTPLGQYSRTRPNVFSGPAFFPQHGADNYITGANESGMARGVTVEGDTRPTSVQINNSKLSAREYLVWMQGTKKFIARNSDLESTGGAGALDPYFFRGQADEFQLIGNGTQGSSKNPPKSKYHIRLHACNMARILNWNSEGGGCLFGMGADNHHNDHTGGKDFYAENWTHNCTNPKQTILEFGSNHEGGKLVGCHFTGTNKLAWGNGSGPVWFVGCFKRDTPNDPYHPVTIADCGGDTSCFRFA